MTEASYRGCVWACLGRMDILPRKRKACRKASTCWTKRRKKTTVNEGSGSEDINTMEAENIICEVDATDIILTLQKTDDAVESEEILDVESICLQPESYDNIPVGSIENEGNVDHDGEPVKDDGSVDLKVLNVTSKNLPESPHSETVVNILSKGQENFQSLAVTVHMFSNTANGAVVDELQEGKEEKVVCDEESRDHRSVNFNVLNIDKNLSDSHSEIVVNMLSKGQENFHNSPVIVHEFSNTATGVAVDEQHEENSLVCDAPGEMMSLCGSSPLLIEEGLTSLDANSMDSVPFTVVEVTSDILFKDECMSHHHKVSNHTCNVSYDQTMESVSRKGHELFLLSGENSQLPSSSEVDMNSCVTKSPSHSFSCNMKGIQLLTGTGSSENVGDCISHVASSISSGSEGHKLDLSCNIPSKSFICEQNSLGGSGSSAQELHSVNTEFWQDVNINSVDTPENFSCLDWDGDVSCKENSVKLTDFSRKDSNDKNHQYDSSVLLKAQEKEEHVKCRKEAAVKVVGDLTAQQEDRMQGDLYFNKLEKVSEDYKVPRSVCLRGKQPVNLPHESIQDKECSPSVIRNITPRYSEDQNDEYFIEKHNNLVSAIKERLAVNLPDHNDPEDLTCDIDLIDHRDETSKTENELFVSRAVKERNDCGDRHTVVHDQEFDGITSSKVLKEKATLEEQLMEQEITTSKMHGGRLAAEENVRRLQEDLKFEKGKYFSLKKNMEDLLGSRDQEIMCIKKNLENVEQKFTHSKKEHLEIVNEKVSSWKHRLEYVIKENDILRSHLKEFEDSRMLLQLELSLHSQHLPDIDFSQENGTKFNEEVKVIRILNSKLLIEMQQNESVKNALVEQKSRSCHLEQTVRDLEENISYLQRKIKENDRKQSSVMAENSRYWKEEIEFAFKERDALKKKITSFEKGKALLQKELGLEPPCRSPEFTQEIDCFRILHGKLLREKKKCETIGNHLLEEKEKRHKLEQNLFQIQTKRDDAISVGIQSEDLSVQTCSHLLDITKLVNALEGQMILSRELKEQLIGERKKRETLMASLKKEYSSSMKDLEHHMSVYSTYSDNYREKILRLEEIIRNQYL